MARPAGLVGVLLALQRTAGNQAVARLLSGRHAAGIARQPDDFSRVDLALEPDDADEFGRVDLGPGDDDPFSRVDLPAMPVGPGNMPPLPAIPVGPGNMPPLPAIPVGPGNMPALPAIPAGPARPAAAAPGPHRPSTAAPAGPIGPQTAAVTATRAYAAIKREFADYQRQAKSAAPGTEDALLKSLESIDHQCTEWLNRHRKALGPQGADRWTEIDKLSKRVARERKKLSRKQAHGVYMKSLIAGHDYGGVTHVPDDYAHKFQAASGGVRRYGFNIHDEFTQYKKFTGGVPQKRLDFVKDKGLTAAEHAALFAFTALAGDYNYINPSQVTQPEYDPATGQKKKSWLAHNREAIKTGHLKGDPTWLQVDDKTVREEGSLHAALAVSGMKKLDPFTGVSYRGESVEEMSIGVNGLKTFPTLTSTSKYTGRTKFFAASSLSDTRNIAVFWTFDHAGGYLPGRDVEALAENANEAEVVLFPGSTFEVESIVEMKEGGVPDAFASLFVDPNENLTKKLLNAKAVYFVTAKMLPPKPGARRGTPLLPKK